MSKNDCGDCGDKEAEPRRDRQHQAPNREWFSARRRWGRRWGYFLSHRAVLAHLKTNASCWGKANCGPALAEEVFGAFEETSVQWSIFFAA